eukprot:2511021-Rhodomonas_salina.3
MTGVRPGSGLMLFCEMMCFSSKFDGGNDASASIVLCAGPKQFDGTASKEAIAQARAMTLAQVASPPFASGIRHAMSGTDTSCAFQASAQGGKMRSPNFLTQRRK